MTYYTREYSRGDALAPEVFQARGPAGLGAIGTVQDMWAYNWHVRWEQNGNVVLAREDLSGWTDVQTLPLSLPDEARRISLAFDQVAQPVIAWEEDGQLWVWEAAPNALRGPFPGRDPILLMDAEISGDISGSDVCLFHLSQDRAVLQCRLQRDAYLLPEDYYLYSNPVHLTRIVQHAFELEIQSTAESVLSSYYPIRSTDAMSGSGHISDGELLAQDIERTHTENMTGTGLVSSGQLEDLYFKVSTEALSGQGGITGGNVDLAFTRTSTEALSGNGLISSGLREVVGIERSNTENMTGSGLISSGLMENIGIERTSTEALSGQGGITGGSLA